MKSHICFQRNAKTRFNRMYNVSNHVWHCLARNQRGHALLIVANFFQCNCCSSAYSHTDVLLALKRPRLRLWSLSFGPYISFIMPAWVVGLCQLQCGSGIVVPLRSLIIFRFLGCGRGRSAAEFSGVEGEVGLRRGGRISCKAGSMSRLRSGKSGSIFILCSWKWVRWF